MSLWTKKSLDQLQADAEGGTLRRSLGPLNLTALGKAITAYLDEDERCSRVALLHQGRVLAMDELARLRTLITGRMLEVITPGRKASDVLRRLPGVVDAQVFGERVHVTLGNGGDSAEAEFRAALASTPLASAPVRAAQPSLEDVFIARLAGAESSHA